MPCAAPASAAEAGPGKTLLPRGHRGRRPRRGQPPGPRPRQGRRGEVRGRHRAYLQYYDIHIPFRET